MLTISSEEKIQIQNDLPGFINKLSRHEGFSLMVKSFFYYMKNTNTLPEALHTVKDEDFQEVESAKYIGQEVFKEMVNIAID